MFYLPNQHNLKDGVYITFNPNHNVSISFSSQTCNADSDVCCTVREAPVTPAPKPVQLQTTPCLDKNYGCVSPDQCYNGEVVSSPNNYADSRPPVSLLQPHTYELRTWIGMNRLSSFFFGYLWF